MQFRGDRAMATTVTELWVIDLAIVFLGGSKRYWISKAQIFLYDDLLNFNSNHSINMAGLNGLACLAFPFGS